MSTFYDHSMLYVPLPNLLFNIITSIPENEEYEDKKDCLHQKDIMEFTPLPNIVGKIDVDSSESDESVEDLSEQVIDNWIQHETNPKQAIINFEKIEIKEEKNNSKNSKPKRDYSLDESFLSKKEQMKQVDNDSNTIKNSKSFGYLPNDKHPIIFGQKQQPEKSKDITKLQQQKQNDIKIEFSNVPHLDIKDKSQQFIFKKENLQKVERNKPDQIRNVNKGNEIKIELPHNRKNESSNEVTIEPKNNSIKIERKTELPTLKFSFKNQNEIPEREIFSSEKELNNLNDYQKITILTN
ncbi:hypothetical protein M9Y10_014644 [Tritrichomonas musculus]|uniref:Uncharacterized protein n=1 Tax=Tritrichomonas musculus TaxID=1915356 RepID=A0ABR2L0K8_9EUKA